MTTTTWFEQELFPDGGKDGRADLSKPSTVAEVFVSNFFGDHQIYLKLVDNNGESVLHLTKKQAAELADSLERAASSIGYDNR